MSMDRIVIVGGGPVGMALALNLAALGTRSVLINREAGPRWHPKGSTQNARTMEHYRRLGIVEKIRTLGLPPDLPTDVVYFTTLSGWEIARIAMPSEREKLRSAGGRAGGRSGCRADLPLQPDACRGRAVRSRLRAAR